MNWRGEHLYRWSPANMHVYIQSTLILSLLRMIDIAHRAGCFGDAMALPPKRLLSAMTSVLARHGGLFFQPPQFQVGHGS
jgi:hypothetical protein